MPAPFTIKKSRYSEFRDIVNKRSLTRSFVISKFGCSWEINKNRKGHSILITLKLCMYVCNISWKNADYRMCQCHLKN